MKPTSRILALLLFLLMLSSCSTSSRLLIAAPDIPDVPQYPKEIGTGLRFSDEKAFNAWRDDVYARSEIPAHADAIAPFMTAGAAQILSGSKSENRLCSPVNLYITLAMLAESTAGETRDEILALLGCRDIDALRQYSRDLWNAIYRNDGTVTRTLATSLWLNTSFPIRRETAARLSQSYYASVYCGTMGSPGMDAALQQWLNDNTMGLLSQQIGELQLPPDGLLALASTVAFQARWDHEFSPSKSTSELFHTPAGDLTCTFMNARRDGPLYWGEHFQAVSLSFDQYAGAMWLILPDEGFTPDDLLKDEDCLTLIATGDCPNSRHMRINLSVPKFDVTSRLELSDSLRELGLNRVFDAGLADFTPLTNADLPIGLDRIQHDARVMIDEEGCKAAAYTVMLLAGAAPPQELEEIDFVLDRPFLFSITGPEGLPLFVGVVYTP